MSEAGKSLQLYIFSIRNRRTFFTEHFSASEINKLRTQSEGSQGNAPPPTTTPANAAERFTLKDVSFTLPALDESSLLCHDVDDNFRGGSRFVLF